MTRVAGVLFFAAVFLIAAGLITAALATLLVSVGFFVVGEYA